MIRITKSNVLWFDGRRTRLMPAGSVFRADDALEARWVGEGVAEYACGDAGREDGEPGAEQASVLDQGAADLSEMTRAELAEMAQSYGIKPGRLSKAKLVEAIEEADEKAPDLSAAEVER